MSRPRFLADQDFNGHILQGVERREPLAHRKASARRTSPARSALSSRWRLS
jgi:hypothetical protein